MSRTSQERNRPIDGGTRARTSKTASAPTVEGPEVAGSARSLVLQAKLRVGAANDPLEREADAAADAFVALRSTGARVLPEAAAAVSDTLGRLSRLAGGAAGSAAAGPVATDDPMGSFDVPTDLESRIAAEQGGGSPLPGALQRDLGSFLGADLSGVRVHRSAESSALNDAIYAKAFTVGSDVFLGRDASVSDTELMAHEVTHVVQQGGAASRTVHRRTDAGKLRKDVNLAEKMSSEEESPDAIDAAEDGALMTGTNSALGIVNDDVFSHDLGSGKELDASIAGGTKGTETAGIVTGMVSAITGFIAAIKTVYELSQNGSAEEAVLAALEGLQSAGDIVKGAIDIAEKAGGAIAETVMPGLDLAFGLLSLLGNVATIVRLHLARKAEDKAMEEARAKGDTRLVTALGNIHAKSFRKLGLSYVQLVGDLGIVVGAAAQLATGPFGMAVKFGGAMVKLLGGIAGAIFQHFEAKATQAARAEFADAAKSGDSKRIEAATMKRLDKDAAYAVREMVTKAVTPNPTTGQKDPAMMKLLATYGIGPTWLAKWEAAGKPPQLLIEAEDMVLRFLGTDRDPKTIGAQITAGLEKVWNWFKGLFSSKAVDAEATASTVTLEAKKAAYPVASAYVVKKAKGGSGGVKPDKLTEELASTYKELVRVYGVGATPAEKAEKLTAIDTGILHALRMLTYPPGFDKRSLAVSGGKVTFTYPYDQKTSTASGKPLAGVAAAAATP